MSDINVFAAARTLDIFRSSCANTVNVKALNFNAAIQAIHEASTCFEETLSEPLQSQIIETAALVVDAQVESRVTDVVNKVTNVKENFESGISPNDSELTELRTEIERLNHDYALKGNQFDRFNQMTRELGELEEKLYSKNLSTTHRRAAQLGKENFNSELLKLSLEERQEMALGVMCLIDPLIVEELKEFWDTYNHLSPKLKTEFTKEVERRGGCMGNLARTRDLESLRMHSEKAMLAALGLSYFLVGKDRNNLEAALEEMKEDLRAIQEEELLD